MCTGVLYGGYRRVATMAIMLERTAVSMGVDRVAGEWQESSSRVAVAVVCSIGHCSRHCSRVKPPVPGFPPVSDLVAAVPVRLL